MPSTVVARPGGFGARLTVNGRQTWLGTHATREEAAQAVQEARLAEHARRARKVRGRPRPARRKPPTMEQVAVLAAEVPARLRGFVFVAGWSGLRLFEVAALEWRDVSVREDGTAVLHVRCGKGGKEGWSLLYGPGVEALRALGWLESGRVFSTLQGTAWDRRSVGKLWVPARARVAGCEAATFHSLRKAHATWLLDNGATDLDVAVQLRHIDQYGRPDPMLVREVYGYPGLEPALERLAVIGS